MKKIVFHSRDNRGQAMIGLVLTLFLVFTLLGFFIYDMNRMQMAQRQLTAVCDAAAMAGSAMLSSQDVSYEDVSQDQIYTAQTTASQYAENMFCNGVILNQRLYDPRWPSGAEKGISVTPVNSQSALNSVGANQVSVFIQLVDPVASNTVYLAGNAQGRAFSVQATYGYVPTLSALGLVGNLPVTAQSTASTQLLNVVMVFDCSGSMDDNTRVSFVERLWDNIHNQYNYQLAGNPGSNNRLYQYSGLKYDKAPNGTQLNVLPPQNLTNLGYLFPAVNQSTGAVTVTQYDFGGSEQFFTKPGLALDMAMRAYCAAPYLANSFPINPNANVAGPFQGPWFDNDFGTPPGNCALKYGNQQANPISRNLWATGVTCWDGQVIASNPPTPIHGWGPDFSPGYYNANSDGVTKNLVTGLTWDGNTYFYDPNAMPPPYTGGTYTPFTDMVANLVNVPYPATQPLDDSAGVCPYGGLSSFTFPGSGNNFYINFAEGRTRTEAIAYESYLSPVYGQTYKFPNIAYLVEAARGNLDLDNAGNPNNYINALLGVSATDFNGITMPLQSDCKYGYQMAYQRLAMFMSQPIASAQAGAFKFFQNLAQTSAAYFGFVGFSVAPTNVNNPPNPDKCTYQFNSTGLPTSLFMNLPSTATLTASNSTLSDFYYQGIVQQAGSSFSINPNVWMWSPTCGTASQGSSSGPAASPTGIPYSPTYNSVGPRGGTWMQESGISSSTAYPASRNLRWAYTSIGWQIPRSFLTNANTDTAAGTTQQSTFNNACGSDTWAAYSQTGVNSASVNSSGYDGLWHCRPLGDTDAHEALQVALANLGVGDFDGLTGGSAGNPNTKRPGAINVLVFFTDGTPTDATDAAFSNYTNDIVGPAQRAGIPIYSIGLALNGSILDNQHNFLTAMANNGANGSQFFQVTDANSLQSAFTGIAKQLTQCQH